MSKKLITILSIMSMICMTSSYAGEDFLSLSVENDLFAATDRHYTHGTRFMYLSEKVNNVPFVTLVESWFPFFGKVTHTGYSFGQYLYSPSDITIRELQENDRPYAGYLYGGLIYTSSDPDNNLMRYLEVNFGMTGPASFGETTQEFVHDILGATDPNWDHQLRNEFIIDTTFQQKHKFLHSSYFDLIQHMGGTLGNGHILANVGLTGRLGYAVPDDFGPYRMEPIPKKDESWNKFYLYTLFGCDGKYVARNIFLDGNTFKDSHSVDKEPFVLDYYVGLALRLSSLEISYIYNWRTKEFETQEKDNEFGSIIIKKIF